MWLRPRTLDEALAARAAHPSWMVLAGGTDLLVHAHRQQPPEGVIDLWRLPALTAIRLDDAGVMLGAGITWHEVAQHPEIVRRLPIVAAAAREIGALQIQTRGTIGGNLATSSPVGDSLPGWLALDAIIHLASARGTRSMPYEAFCAGYRKTVLAADELITGIFVPWPTPDTQLFFRKVGTRRAQSISKVVAAAAFTVTDGVICTARIAVGAVADRPVRLRDAEAAAVTCRSAEDVARVVDAVRHAITPLSDVRSTADYRRQTAAAVVARFVTRALATP